MAYPAVYEYEILGSTLIGVTSKTFLSHVTLSVTRSFLYNTITFTN